MLEPLPAIRVGRSSKPTRAVSLVTRDRTRMLGGAVFIDIDKGSGAGTVGLPTQSITQNGALP
jgi:hypothetical protein